MLSVIIIIGGCNLSKSDKENNNEKFADLENLPKTEAFQDEFTREFLVSTEEVEEGYYLLESKTSGYRMLFLKNASVAGGGFYDISKENTYEKVHLSESNEQENINYYIKVIYENKKITNDIDFNLSRFSKSYNYKGEFEKYQANGNEIYFANYVKDTSHIVEGSFYYVFLGYIKFQNSDQAVSISYGSTCYDDSLECNIDKDVEREKARKIFESIEFID